MCALVTEGKRDPCKACVQDLMFMSRLDRNLLSDFTFTFHFHALEKEMATHSSVLAWRIPGTGEPAIYGVVPVRVERRAESFASPPDEA